MKIKGISLYCSILLMFCQVFLCNSAFAVSEEKVNAVRENCAGILEVLKSVQREDSVVRTHIGPYYNNVLEKFIKPLNSRLVENNMFDTGLLNNQSNFVTAQEVFRADYSEYQRELSELTAMDCVADPAGFYEKLESVRERRRVVSLSVSEMRGLVSEQMTLVEGLRDRI